jgi:transcriptional regulator with XRE-family HTH domain
VKARRPINLDTLKRLCTAQGLGEKDLAERSGVDLRTIERIWDRTTGAPQWGTIKLFARALGVGPDALCLDCNDAATPSEPDPPETGHAKPAVGTAEPDLNEGADLYNPWTPATPPAFVGRLDMLRALEAAAVDGRSVSLVGERRMGKSSILCTWAEWAAAQGWPVRLLSGEGPEAAGHSELLAQLLGTAAAAASAPLSPDAAADRLDAWCRAQADACADAAGASRPAPGPLLLLDEAESFLQRADPCFLTRLRGLITARRLRLVVATARELDQVYADLGRTSPFPNLLELRRVALLDAPAARQLIARGAAHWQPGDADWMLDWAGTHPFYLTLLARRLLEARRDGRPREHALDVFRDEAETQLRLWWNALDEPTRTLLHRVARGEAVDAFRLRRRGILTDDSRPLGRVMSAWLSEMNG